MAEIIKFDKKKRRNGPDDDYTPQQRFDEIMDDFDKSDFDKLSLFRDIATPVTQALRDWRDSHPEAFMGVRTSCDHYNGYGQLRFTGIGDDIFKETGVFISPDFVTIQISTVSGYRMYVDSNRCDFNVAAALEEYINITNDKRERSMAWQMGGYFLKCLVEYMQEADWDLIGGEEVTNWQNGMDRQLLIELFKGDTCATIIFNDEFVHSVGNLYSLIGAGKKAASKHKELLEWIQENGIVVPEHLKHIEK